jgi:hypothetical protein
MGGVVAVSEKRAYYPGDPNMQQAIYDLAGNNVGLINSDKRSGIRQMSRNPFPNTGMGTTPTALGGLFPPDLNGNGSAQKQLSQTQPNTWDDVRGRGFYNIYTEFKDVNYRHFYPLYPGYTARSLQLRYGGRNTTPGSHTEGQRSIYMYNSIKGSHQDYTANGFMLDNNSGTGGTSCDNGYVYADRRQKSVLDTQRWSSNPDAAAHMALVRPSALQTAKMAMVGPNRRDMYWGHCDPIGPDSGRPPGQRNPCYWPSNGFGRRVRWLFDYPAHNAFYENVAAIPPGAEPATTWIELEWLRGRSMQYCCETPAVRAQFIKWMGDTLGKREGLFDPNLPGAEQFGIEGVAEIFRTDRYRCYSMKESALSSPHPVKWGSRDLRNDPVYGNMTFDWKTDGSLSP